MVDRCALNFRPADVLAALSCQIDDESMRADRSAIAGPRGGIWRLVASCGRSIVQMIPAWDAVSIGTADTRIDGARLDMAEPTALDGKDPKAPASRKARIVSHFAQLQIGTR